MTEPMTIEQLTPEAVQAAIVALQGLPMEKLQEILKTKRAAAKVQEAANVPVPPFPEYVKPKDKADVLNYEYGLELAYRPAVDKSPRTFKAVDLVNCMHVKPYMPLKKPDRYSYNSFTGEECVMQHMFRDMVKQTVKILDAKEGADKLSSCGTEEIEFVSPIMDRLSQIDWYYALVRGIADHMGAKVETAKVNSGGGHIHATPKTPLNKLITFSSNWSLAQKSAMVLDVCRKPWLPWIFNDPDDHDTARSPVLTVFKAVWEASKNPNADWRNGLDSKLSNMAVRFNHQKKPTLEFRMFGAPLNAAEQKLHVIFLDRWIKKTISDKDLEAKTKRQPMLKYTMPADFEDISYDKAVGEFKNQLAGLKLDYADYQPFVERNLKFRYDKKLIRN